MIVRGEEYPCAPLYMAFMGKCFLLRKGVFGNGISTLCIGENRGRGAFL